MSTTLTTTGRRGPDRRSFLTWSAAVGGTGALVATAVTLGMPTSRAKAAEGDGMADADATVWSACTVNCGSRCPVRLQVKGLIRIQGVGGVGIRRPRGATGRCSW